VLFRRNTALAPDLSGLGPKALFFVRVLTWAYRVAILTGFYMLFYAVMGGLNMLEMATVLVAGVIIILSSRQGAVWVALLVTRLRHGEMSAEERTAVSERLQPLEPPQQGDGQPDKDGGSPPP
jgi:hypothetical protein